MEWIIGIGAILFLLGIGSRSKNRPKSDSSGGPTISVSSHPNAGLISFLDPEDCYNQGILPKKTVAPCGCVTYSDDLGASATDCCATCSENSPF